MALLSDAAVFHDPEFPDVTIRVSGQLLTEWFRSDGPIRMAELGDPDSQGFYSPTLSFDASKCPRACCSGDTE